MIIDWRGWTAGQWILRALVVAGSLVALYSRALAVDRPPAWVGVLVLALAVAWAAVPDSVVGVAVLLLVGWSWAAGDPDGVPLAALLAAAGMVTAHLSALVVGYGPPRLPVAPGAARLWALRGVVVLLPAFLVWLVGKGVAELPVSSTVWVLGLAVAVSVVVVAVAVFQALMPQGDDR